MSKPTTIREVLQRYPRLVGHMISASLGYFSVDLAARALLCYIEHEPCYCEWYSHMARFRKERDSEERMLALGKDVLAVAFRGRHSHKGYMASYEHASALVKAELERSGCTQDMLASWF